MQLLRKKGILETSRVLFLPIDSIQPNPNQPRRIFTQQSLEELAESIRFLGLLQPLTVRRASDGSWELIAGERRLRAARLAGLTVVPCLSVQADHQASSLFALVENLQRRDLDFWEEAAALNRLIAEYGLSQEEIARQIGKSQSAVANKLRLLKLPAEALEILRAGACTERHARALLPLESSDLQIQCARTIVEEKLTVAQTEGLVAKLRLPPPEKSAAPRRAFILKDVRLFLNTLNRGIAMMRSAGVNAKFDREDREEEILVTIHIPCAGQSHETT